MLRNLLSFLFIFLFTAIYAQVGVGTAAATGAAVLRFTISRRGINIPLSVATTSNCAEASGAAIQELETQNTELKERLAKIEAKLDL